jgi:two-component system cell cycle response regulator
MENTTQKPFRPKLLCVEDDKGVLDSVERLLGRDFQVLKAHSTAQAMSQLDQNPDTTIVLSDYSLPDGNGLQLLANVQNKAPDAVRAIFSGQIDIEDMVGAINKSLLHRFILKPWDNEYFRLQMLEALANHSTLREKRMLEQLSVTDQVTTLKNHRYFQDRLRIETERAIRHKRPLTLAMLDLDRFKNVNDTYGHPVGDLLLRAVGLRMLDKVRTIDTVARYGGEEFAILMPDTQIESALIVSERIRESFEKNDFLFPNLPPIHITVSIGLAAITDQAESPMQPKTATELLARADQALYQAKSQGRNQTAFAVDAAQLK